MAFGYGAQARPGGALPRDFSQAWGRSARSVCPRARGSTSTGVPMDSGRLVKDGASSAYGRATPRVETWRGGSVSRVRPWPLVMLRPPA